MRFLVDAQLPATLAQLLSTSGHDAVHVSTLPSGNRTPDAEIARTADEQHRVVITKDRDFRDSHLLTATPRSLLTVTTGNITNRQLLDLFRDHLEAIINLLDRAAFVELSHDRLIAHSLRKQD
ncbi:MAG: DUF5615 family PIN-like protein [Tomitella sp.]|nr:DUF5615 family PIN-like protein [Tomitella sp.]